MNDIELLQYLLRFASYPSSAPGRASAFAESSIGGHMRADRAAVAPVTM
jgi:hypothetical protein